MLMVGTRYLVSSDKFEEAIKEYLDMRNISLLASTEWSLELLKDRNQFLDVTLTADGWLEFDAMPGAHVRNVAGGLFNFALHFKRNTRCSFNGYRLEITENV